uniref:sugar transferase n=1 Tax=Ningiella ruwaisensis TaxID=2364274 RepID=UPI0010A077B0|nr:sugar transferase [Ningiella ruwaisensis]
MIKRLIDIFISFFALLILSPLIVLIVILVKINLGSPVLFTQNRPGKDGVVFKLFKLRSMTNLKDAKGQLLPDDQRLTNFGRFLRSTSLDELPSLLNVLKGEMSLVGPRPLLVEYLPLYTPFQKRRHELRPGITGWAQVNGRNSLSWEEKFKFDVWYVDNQSMRLDLKILCMTVFKVIKRADINERDTATMTKFTSTLNSDIEQKQ